MKSNGSALKWGAFFGACGMGLFVLFLNRFVTGSDQNSYLDFAGNLARGSWFSNLNGYWGPLLPAWIALAFRFVHPSPAWELPVAKGMLYLFYVFALAASLFLHARLARLLQEKFPGRWTAEKSQTLFLFGFAAVFGIACCLLGLGLLADLPVLGFFFVGTGMIAGFLQRAATLPALAGFALVLALGYLSKSIFFLLAAGFIASFYGSQRNHPGRKFHTGLLAALFLLFSAVQWLPLSLAKERLTFGDAGKINYVWFMAQGKYAVAENLQTSLDGTPLKHPFQIISQNPLIYGFGDEVSGAMPNWYDPSYYMDGLHSAIRPVRQAVVIFLNLIRAANVLGRGLTVTPGLEDDVLGVNLALLTFLALLAVVPTRRRALTGAPWELLLPACLGLGLYLLTSLALRYVAPFLLVILIVGVAWLLVEAEPFSDRPMRGIALAFFALTFLGLLAQSVEAFHLQLREGGLRAMLRDPEVAAARELHRLGVKPGARVAEIGDLAGVYFFHPARVRVLAQVQDESGFWKLSPAEKQRVDDLLAGAGMEAVIARVPPTDEAPPDWIPIGESGYLLHDLPSRVP